MNLAKIMSFLTLSGGLLLASGTVQTARAASQDECAIWLCLPGGFPSGCAGAFSAFIDRIRNLEPPLPPFGDCAEGPADGSYEMGYEPFVDCAAGYEPHDWVYRDRFAPEAEERLCAQPGVCQRSYEGDSGGRTVCSSGYVPEQREKPRWIEMTVNNQNLGRYYYSHYRD